MTKFVKLLSSKKNFAKVPTRTLLLLIKKVLIHPHLKYSPELELLESVVPKSEMVNVFLLLAVVKCLIQLMISLRLTLDLLELFMSKCSVKTNILSLKVLIILSLAQFLLRDQTIILLLKQEMLFVMDFVQLQIQSKINVFSQVLDHSKFHALSIYLNSHASKFQEKLS
jgi:hypothetical protein